MPRNRSEARRIGNAKLLAENSLRRYRDAAGVTEIEAEIAEPQPAPERALDRPQQRRGELGVEQVERFLADRWRPRTHPKRLRRSDDPAERRDQCEDLLARIARLRTELHVEGIERAAHRDAHLRTPERVTRAVRVGVADVGGGRGRQRRQHPVARIEAQRRAIDPEGAVEVDQRAASGDEAPLQRRRAQGAGELRATGRADVEPGSIAASADADARPQRDTDVKREIERQMPASQRRCPRKRHEGQHALAQRRLAAHLGERSALPGEREVGIDGAAAEGRGIERRPDRLQLRLVTQRAARPDIEHPRTEQAPGPGEGAQADELGVLAPEEQRAGDAGERDALEIALVAPVAEREAPGEGRIVEPPRELADAVDSPTEYAPVPEEVRREPRVEVAHRQTRVDRGVAGPYPQRRQPDRQLPGEIEATAREASAGVLEFEPPVRVGERPEEAGNLHPLDADRAPVETSAKLRVALRARDGKGALERSGDGSADVREPRDDAGDIVRARRALQSDRCGRCEPEASARARVDPRRRKSEGIELDVTPIALSRERESLDREPEERAVAKGRAPLGARIRVGALEHHRRIDATGRRDPRQIEHRDPGREVEAA